MPGKGRPSSGYIRGSTPIGPEHPLPRAGAAALLKKWVKANRPDAIYTDYQQILPLLESAKLRVPHDIAVAATSMADTGIDSGIDQHPEEIGRVGMLLLNSIINDSAIGIPPILRQILVQGSWIQGTTMPPRPEP